MTERKRSRYVQYCPRPELWPAESAISGGPITGIEIKLTTIKLAIAELTRRVTALEGRGAA